MKIIFIILYAYLLTPFIELNILYRAVTTEKNFYFRIITELLLGALLYLVLKRQKIKIKLSPVFAAAGLAAIITTLATFRSTNFWISFMGNYQRMEGTLTWIHLFIILAVLCSVTIKKSQWYHWFTAAVVISTIICCRNVYDYFLFSGANRVHSVINNSAFLANYIAVNFFICLILMFKKCGWWKVLFSAIALLHLWVIILAGTRSVIIALVFSFVFTLIFMLSKADRIIAYCQQKFCGKWMALSTYILAAAVSIGMLLSVHFATSYLNNNKTATGEYKDTTSRLFSYRISDPTINLRLVLWDIGLKESVKNLWTGTGPEEFKRVCFENFNPSLADKDAVYDRPHNSYVYCLVSTGILGLIAFVAIFTSAFICCVGMPDYTERFILSMLVVYFFCQGFFIFNHIASLIPFVILLGYIVHRTYKSGKVIIFKNSSSLPAIPTLIAGCFTVLVILICNKTMLIANYKINSAFGDKEHPSVSNLEKCKIALDCPYPWRHDAVGNYILFFFKNFLDSKCSPLGESYLDTVLENIKKDTGKYPKDLRTQALYASFFR